jgi:hypothetical protein
MDTVSTEATSLTSIVMIYKIMSLKYIFILATLGLVEVLLQEVLERILRNI